MVINGDAEKSKCSVWNDTVKCWGDQHAVDPTYSESTLSPQYWYQPPIEALDLGTSFTAESVSCGGSHQYSLSTSGTVRCWGDDSFGQLGYENTAYFSDGANYGVDIDFGSGVVIDQLAVGDGFDCVLTTIGEVKCWGINDHGQLGYGTTNTVGDNIGEMGDAMGIKTLGDDFDGHITEICVGGGHACALSDGNDIKCWGSNDRGQLGYGHTDNIGDNGDEMGNTLANLDFGDIFTPIHVVCGQSHSCAVSDQDDIKCCGMW